LGIRIAVNLFSKEFDELKKRITQEAEIGRNPADQHVGAEEYAGGTTLDAAGGFACYKDPPRVIKKKKDTKRKIPIGGKVQMQMKAKQAK
jgi:hypothetical protein